VSTLFAGADGFGPFPTLIFPGFTIDRAEIPGHPGFTAFDVVQEANEKVILELPGCPRFSLCARFSLFDMIALVPTDPMHFNTLIITGREFLSDANSAFDFSAFNAGTFSLAFNTDPGIDLAALIKTVVPPPIVTFPVPGEGSFVQEADQVPEPTSLFLLGIGGLGLLGYAHRQRSRATPDTRNLESPRPL
jgi:hypothetical protein